MIRLFLLLIFVLFVIHVVENKGFHFTVDVDGKPTKYGFQLEKTDGKEKH